MKNIFLTLLFMTYLLAATAQNNDIFGGGNGHGWITATFLQPPMNVFAGGNGDGWSVNNFLQAGNDIFTGGDGDGWSSAYRPQGPLPVNFTYFNAQKNGPAAVSVIWKTAQESNSAWFYVERSVDAVRFNFIGKVKAAGNSSVATQYIFIDKSPAKGANYYRLKQVDHDGHFIYTPSRLILFEELYSDAKYYPNPTAGFLNVEPTKIMRNEDKVINITNASGVVLDQLRVKGSNAPLIKIDMAKYGKGVYFLQLITASANSVQRIVVQ